MSCDGCGLIFTGCDKMKNPPCLRSSPERSPVMSEELKPCPFCGGEAKITDHGKGRGGWMISCENFAMSDGKCGVLMTPCADPRSKTPDELHESGKRRAITAWNTRLKVEPTEFIQRSFYFNKDAEAAFRKRERSLRSRTKWPLTKWYNDEDFCKTYNDACHLIAHLQAKNKAQAEEITTSRDRVAELEEDVIALWKHNKECMIYRFSAIGCQCGLEEPL